MESVNCAGSRMNVNLVLCYVNLYQNILKYYKQGGTKCLLLEDIFGGFRFLKINMFHLNINWFC
jgi:hypothetical protein